MHEAQVDKVRAVFDDWALKGRGDRMAITHGEAARRGFEALGVKPGDRYLDVGCGVGYTVRWAAAVDPTVKAFGLDVSEEMIGRARVLGAELGNTRFIHSAFPLPMLRTGGFDVVFSMEVFYYLPDLAAGLAEVARLLRVGGRFACLVDLYEENVASHVWPEDLGVPMTLLSAQGWVEALQAAGFGDVTAQRLLAPSVEGQAPAWEQTEGTLCLMGTRA